MSKKLYLLDGMALIYRAHFALSKSPRFTTNGLNTSAVFGFANTLLELIRRESPSHIAVVFDTAAPTERHTDYVEYKAHREAMPEDLSLAIPYVFQLIEGFNIPVITMDGYEADDIIGTLAKQAEKEGFDVYCMTPDKDFAQLVSEHIFIYKPARMGNDIEIMGVPEVLKKWEIEHIHQVIDILGLWGDAVDNIPGIPGIGEKTAKELIRRYGSMENIIANSHELKGKQKENVENFAEQGLLSKKLATIILNVPVQFDEKQYHLDPPSRELLEPLFAELEFRTLGRRVFGEEFTIAQASQNAAANSNAQMDLFGQQVLPSKRDALPTEEESIRVYKTINEVPHNYHFVESDADINNLIENLSNANAICFDTETTSTDANTAELVGMSFAIKTTEAYYVPVPADKGKAVEIASKFKAVLENPNIEKIGQNIKYDITVLASYGISVKGKLFDTMLAQYIVDADARNNMDIMANAYLDYSPVSITTLIGAKGKNQGNMRDIEPALVKDYAAEDADITLQLKEVLSGILKENNGEELFYNIETPLVYVLSDMERTGVKVDEETLKVFSKELEIDIRNLEETIYEKAGVKFNIASPKQLGEVLFDKLQLDPKAKKTKTGQYQTGEDVLTALSPKHDIVQYILDFRSLQKLKSTYVDALPEMINPSTGRVHTSYNQAVAATGRLSSNNPNLQNIPIKTARGREVRKAFIAKDNEHLILSADYSQIELRIIAEMADEKNMLEAFSNGLDIHTATAAKVYGITIEEVTSTQRRNAKAVNFGIIYGQSAFGLSQGLGIPRKEAQEIIENYFTQYPGIKKYMSDTIEFAKANGYVETLMKRRRYLRDINSANATVRGFAERNAINAPIQGSAADMIKVAMINIFNEMNARNLRSKMTMQVHDELVFEVHQSELEEMKALVIDKMQTAMKLNVPILVEVGVGKDWLEAH
ncbi:MAG: DNA polymerase I [Sphingobacteriales bacterium]|nr:DNA polymerase I [Sphingobacteriales bacterium]